MNHPAISLVSVIIILLVTSPVVHATAATICANISSPCATQSDCCQSSPNGVFCQLNSSFYFSPPVCAYCPPIASACLDNSDCCDSAPYGYKGWCRSLTPGGITFCAQCQPDGGLCDTRFPGLTAAACCSHPLSRCNATTGLCYNATGISPPTTLTASPTPLPPILPTNVPTNGGDGGGAKWFNNHLMSFFFLVMVGVLFL